MLNLCKPHSYSREPISKLESKEALISLLHQWRTLEIQYLATINPKSIPLKVRSFPVNIFPWSGDSGNIAYPAVRVLAQTDRSSAKFGGCKDVPIDSMRSIKPFSKLLTSPLSQFIDYMAEFQIYAIKMGFTPANVFTIIAKERAFFGWRYKNQLWVINPYDDNMNKPVKMNALFPLWDGDKCYEPQLGFNLAWQWKWKRNR